MSDTSPLAAEEYRALRATIRERGTMRLIVSSITFVTWAALVLAVQALLSSPAFCLMPLTVLAGGFEVVFAAHVGVERIGRYLYVHYEAEDRAAPGWEHAITRVGAEAGAGSGIDPLFSVVFIVAVLLNLIPVALMAAVVEGASAAGISATAGFFGVAHALVIVRILRARQFAASQRRRDTELFQRNPALAPRPSNPLV